MNKRLLLTIVLGAMFCTVSFAQEERINDPNEPAQGDIESLHPEKDTQTSTEESDSSMPKSTPEKEQTPHKTKARTKVVTKTIAGDPMSVRITYRGGQLNQWELYKQKEQLAARIKYKNNRPVIVQVFDSNGKLKNGDYKVFYPDGKLKAIRTYRKGVQLKEAGYYESGQVQYELKKNKGGKIVMFRAYEPDGGLKEGSIKEFYPNGELKGMGSFRKGRPEGNFVSFCEDGEIVAEKEFKKGRLLSKNWKEDTAKGSRICEDAFSYLDSEVTPLITVSAKKSCT